MALYFIKSPLLGQAKHGFFTRIGGVSQGQFAELNCGFGSSENKVFIRQNRALIAQDIGVKDEHLLTVKQVHSSNVITIENIADFEASSEADAMVTNQSGIALAVLTADCAPVLFHDLATGIIGAAHAGWRGAICGVLEATIAAMCDLGAQRGQIMAAVGPCISQKNYEVGQEFLEEFLDENTSYSRFFINAPQEKYLFDLPGFALHRLRQARIAGAEWCGQCTYANPKMFFSYRYSQHNSLPNYGRMLSVITN